MIFLYIIVFMGIKYVDYDTIGHFCGGVLSYTMIQYSNVPLGYNFIIANGIHYMIIYCKSARQITYILIFYYNYQNICNAVRVK
jgi:hypothetical protein